MPSILNSDDGVVSGTSGLKTTGGNDGITTFQQNGTEQMRITATGNVGIGTSSPTSKLHIAASGDVSGKVVNSATTGSAVFNVTNNSGALAQLMIYGSTQGAYGALGSGEAAIYSTTSLTMMSDTGSGVVKFATGGNAERARIDSSGNLLVGLTSGTGSRTEIAATWPQNLLALKVTSSNASAQVADFLFNGAAVGSIICTASSTAYNTSSDYRLKDNVQPMTGALAKVQALKPVTYKWKIDGSDGEGFIAHELAEVVPQCVSGEKDATDADGNPVYQGIDTSFLVATLTAAIQEQQAMIDTMKQEIAELKAKVQA
jgi:hypothetical protein